MREQIRDISAQIWISLGPVFINNFFSYFFIIKRNFIETMCFIFSGEDHEIICKMGSPWLYICMWMSLILELISNHRCGPRKEKPLWKLISFYHPTFYSKLQYPFLAQRYLPSCLRGFKGLNCMQHIIAQESEQDFFLKI